MTTCSSDPGTTCSSDPRAGSAGSVDSRSRMRKSVLFCPECEYDSPVTDNWLEVTAGDERVLVCPACGAVVDHRTRPRRSGPVGAD